MILDSGSAAGSLIVEVFDAGVTGAEEAIGSLEPTWSPVVCPTDAKEREANGALKADRDAAKRREEVRRAAIAKVVGFMEWKYTR